MINSSYLIKYAINYLSKYSSSKKNLEKILKLKIQRSVKEKKERYLLYSHINLIIEKLESNNLINDQNYTQSKIDLLVSQSKSKSFIYNYLIKKGIESSLIKNEITNYENSNENWEEKSAYNFAKKKRLLDSKENTEKKLSKMSRAGFPYYIFKNILKIN